MMVHSYSLDDALADELLPANNEEEGAGYFSSMEISQPKPRSVKREARPLLNLIMDILETFYTSSKAESKRSQIKEGRFTR